MNKEENRKLKDCQSRTSGQVGKQTRQQRTSIQRKDKIADRVSRGERKERLCRTGKRMAGWKEQVRVVS